MTHILLTALGNAIPIFWTSIVLVEVGILIFPRVPFRLRYLLRLIPLVKLPFDLVRYQWINWTYAAGIDPVCQTPNTRFISLSVGLNRYFPNVTSTFHLQSGETFTWVDWVTHNWSPALLFLTLVLLGSIALYKVVLVAAHEIGTLRWLKQLNGQLVGQVDNIAIVAVDSLSSPCTTSTGNKRILLPPTALQLPQEQITAVLAHEKSHLQWRDDLVSLVARFIRACFWFVPGMNWWWNRIALDCEIACDQACSHKGIGPLVMAEALIQSARNQAKNTVPLPSLVKAKTHLVKRLDILLTRQKKSKVWLTLSSSALLAYWGVGIGLARLWLL